MRAKQFNHKIEETDASTNYQESNTQLSHLLQSQHEYWNILKHLAAELIPILQHVSKRVQHNAFIHLHPDLKHK